MGWSKWINLEIPKDSGMSMPFDLPAPSGPRFPYGMRISLDNHCLEAAELDDSDVKVGDEIDIRAFGTVVRYENDEGRKCMCIQLTKIKVENEDAEDEEDD